MPSFRNAVTASVIALLTAMSSPARAISFAGGTGEPNDPYQIATAEQLASVGADTKLLMKHFILTEDISLSGTIFSKAVIPKFSGSFDGNGHSVLHLTIKQGASEFQGQGLFGELARDAEVGNLGVVDVNISGSLAWVGALAQRSYGYVSNCHSSGVITSSGDFVGGLVGENSFGTVIHCRSSVEVTGDMRVGGLLGRNDGGTVSDCNSTGAVTGTWTYVGGLVGDNVGRVVDCHSTGTVSGRMDVGGLVGYNTSGAISNCHSTGNVSGDSSIGGLVGYNQAGCGITNCWSSGAVHGSMYDAGGLVGVNNSGRIVNCRSTGAVVGYSMVGGLVGLHAGSISNCSSTGNVTGDSWVGGLVADCDGNVDHCYSTGKVTAKSYVGGLLPFRSDNSSVSACFWDIQTSGCTSSREGTGLTTAQMKSEETYLQGGWDFVGESGNGTAEVWQMPSEGGYPMLSSFGDYHAVHLDGEGTVRDPYRISSPEDLGAVWRNPAAYYKLNATIDLSGITWPAAVIPEFFGTFDGGGFTISNLTLRGGGYLGLFGTIMPGARVKNLSLVDTNVVGSWRYIGGVAGYNWGDLRNCRSDGNVTGHVYIGGLIGYNDDGSLSHCYTSGTVTGTVIGTWVGGLTGGNAGGLANCYSVSKVVGGSFGVGGLVGAVAAFSYNAQGCFWDTQASGRTSSAGGTGLTTAQMKDARTYLAAGWDLAGESDNGTSETWLMPEGGGYPVLNIFCGYHPVQLAGKGTSEEPYLISNGAELGAMVWYDPTASYRLAANIDLSTIRWSAAVIPELYGTFDGSGCEISGLRIEGAGNLGLFDRLMSDARVHDISVADANVVGSWKNVGVLAGRSAGNVSRCRSDGKASGLSFVGGLVGYNDLGGVDNCYSSAAFAYSGFGGYAGGLIGRNTGCINNCYSMGPGTGSFPGPGGLVGSGAIEYGTVYNSFWDSQTSGCTHSAGGTDHVTAAMKKKATFTGWNFEGIWTICESNDYPRLKWEERTCP